MYPDLVFPESLDNQILAEEQTDGSLWRLKQALSNLEAITVTVTYSHKQQLDQKHLPWTYRI